MAKTGSVGNTPVSQSEAAGSLELTVVMLVVAVYTHQFHCISKAWRVLSLLVACRCTAPGGREAFKSPAITFRVAAVQALGRVSCSFERRKGDVQQVHQVSCQGWSGEQPLNWRLLNLC